MENVEQSRRLTDRRSFLMKGAALGAGAIGASRLVTAPPASASGGLTKGDVAVLQFLAAAELLEADLWEQYNELGGIQDSERPGGTGNKAYTRALSVLDKDMPITSTTTPMTSRATRTSSTRIWRQTARIPSTWTSSARCPAARRLALVRSAV
jgi:hypothetical protein